MSCSPFTLTFVAFFTPFIVSALYSSFEHRCFAFVTIGFVSFLGTTVSPSFAFLLTILSVSVSFAIELLLEVVSALESLLVSGFVGLNLC